VSGVGRCGSDRSGGGTEGRLKVKEESTAGSGSMRSRPRGRGEQEVVTGVEVACDGEGMEEVRYFSNLMVSICSIDG
jgi:hypothetical protein